MKLLVMQFSPVSRHFTSLRSQYSPQHAVLVAKDDKKPWMHDLAAVWTPTWHTYTASCATKWSRGCDKENEPFIRVSFGRG
jgi:hypothetical protein